jgi:RHS repeat-associated protein
VIADTGAVYTPGLSERRNGVSTFLHTALKDATAQSNTSQQLSSTRSYDAFGMVVGQSGAWKGPFGYAGASGYQEDETGLQLLGHRYYDPSTGRFLTRDPIQDGRNWYVYCGNDPVNGVDPEGLAYAVIRASRRGLGHVWILIFFDDGTAVAMDNSLFGARQIYVESTKGFQELYNRPFDDQRVVKFDQSAWGGKKGVLETIREGTRNDYNLITSNCCTFALCVWLLLTGEWLGDVPDPDQVSKEIRRRNTDDLAKRRRKPVKAPRMPRPRTLRAGWDK